MQQKTSLNFQSESNTRLWRKLSSKPNVQDEKSTDKSLVKTFQTEIKAQHVLAEQKKFDPLVQFLQRVHHRVNNEGLDSQSQIIQRLSLQWPQQSFQKCPPQYNQKKLMFSEELYVLNQGWRTQRNLSSESEGLKDLKNLFELQAYVTKTNPLLAEELQELMRENEKLAQECNCTRYNDKKTILRLQLLNNQIHMLEKKNQELVNQNEKLKQIEGSNFKKLELKIENCTCSYDYLNELRQNQLKIELENNNENQQVNGQSNISDSGNNSKSPDKLELQQSIQLHRNSSTTSTRSNKLLNLNHHDFNCIASEIFGVPKKTSRVTRKI